MCKVHSTTSFVLRTATTNLFSILAATETRVNYNHPSVIWQLQHCNQLFRKTIENCSTLLTSGLTANLRQTPNNLLPQAFARLTQSNEASHLTPSSWNSILEQISCPPDSLCERVQNKTKQKSNFIHNVKSRKRHQQYGGQSSLSFLDNTQRLIHSVMSLCQNSHRVSGKDLICVHEMSREETTLIWYKRITDCFRRGGEANMLEDGVWSDIQRSFLRTCSTKDNQYTHTDS
jgi:hypothetical protein